MDINLEIACFNLESALTAAKSGADRLELCSDIEAGGTTPLPEIVKTARQKISNPIYIMIRPRGGNFIYSNSEFDQMKTEILNFKSLKVDGFVFGILDNQNEVDIARNTELVNLAAPFPCTFHRAFDRTKDYKKALENVIKCGFKTILTSGLVENAIAGLSVLNDLVKIAGNRINIMPGGGVRSLNISEIIHKTNAPFYHSSAIVNKGEAADKNEVKALKFEIYKH